MGLYSINKPLSLGDGSPVGVVDFEVVGTGAGDDDTWVLEGVWTVGASEEGEGTTEGSGEGVGGLGTTMQSEFVHSLISPDNPVYLSCMCA